MEQASPEVQALGRKADTVAKAPLLHRALNSTSHLAASKAAQGKLLPVQGAGAIHRHAGLGREAAGQQAGTEKMGMLSQSLESTFLH